MDCVCCGPLDTWQGQAIDVRLHDLAPGTVAGGVALSARCNPWTAGHRIWGIKLAHIPSNWMDRSSCGHLAVRSIFIDPKCCWQ